MRHGRRTTKAESSDGANVRKAWNVTEWSAAVQAVSTVVIVIITILLFILNRSMAEANQAMAKEAKRTNDMNADYTTRLLRKQAARFEIGDPRRSAPSFKGGPWRFEYSTTNVGRGIGYNVTLYVAVLGNWYQADAASAMSIAPEETEVITLEVWPTEDRPLGRPNVVLSEYGFEDADGMMWVARHYGENPDLSAPEPGSPSPM